MKITLENYFEQVDNYMHLINSDKLFRDSHDYMVKFSKEGKDFSSYHKSDKIREVVDLYLQALNQKIEKVQKKTTTKPAKSVVKKTATEKKVPEPRQKNAPGKKEVPAEEKVSAERVEHIPSDIALVKKYISLHDKDKSYEQVLSISRAFNKAIVERKVTKDSPYKAQITDMNSSLKNAAAQAGAVGTLHLVIPAAKLKTYRAITESVEKAPSIGILMEFINIAGKPAMQERADKLNKRIDKAIAAGKLTGDRYLKDVKKAKTELEAYLNKETDVVGINDYSLSGIGEIAVFGCTCEQGLEGFNRSQNAVIYKLIQEKVKSLRDDELDRAFSDTVAPSLCKTIAQKLIEAKLLTMALLKNPAKVSGSLALSGSGRDRYKHYDFGTEILDMKLRNAGRVAKHTAAKEGINIGFSGTDDPILQAPGSEDAKIISANELVSRKFRTIGLKGKYRKLIGDPEPGFSTMIYGKPKQGKSTIAIDFAKDLTATGRVLYVAFEEGQGLTLQDKVIRNKANVPGLDFANKLPVSLSGYRHIFIDSVSDAGFDEATLKALIKANKPNDISIHGIFHATKDGKFRGSQTFAHDVDILMRVENGIVYAQGRYAPPAEMSISGILPEEYAQAA